MTKYLPINDYVLISLVEEKKSGSLFLCAQEKKQFLTGYVLAVGDDSQLKLGDAVYFNRYEANQINDSDQYLIKEKLILAILEQ